MIAVFASSPELSAAEGDVVRASRRSVSLDWSGVSETTVQRCKLRGLQNLLLQSLVETGHAVVGVGSREDISVVIADAPAALQVSVTRQSERLQRVVAVGARCDSTVALELKNAVEGLLEQLSTEPPPEPPPPAPPPAPVVVAVAPPAPPAPRDDWRFTLGGGATILRSPTFAPTLRATVVRALGDRWGLGVALDGSFVHRLGLWVIEPVASAHADVTLVKSGDVAFAVGLEVGALAHIYNLDQERRGVRMSGRVGVPLELRGPFHINLNVIPFLRMTPVTHRVDGQTAFDAGRAGLELALVVALP